MQYKYKGQPEKSDDGELRTIQSAANGREFATATKSLVETMHEQRVSDPNGYAVTVTSRIG
jgi:hypothetical protein